MVPEKLKQTTAFFRKRLKQRNIKAHVRCDVSCGWQTVRLSVVEFGRTWTDDEQGEILSIAYACHLIGADRQPLRMNDRTYSSSAVFLLPSE